MSEQEESKVHINDRRRFSPEGEAKPDAPETNPAAEAPAPEAEAPETASAAAEATQEPQAEMPQMELPPASFQFLVMSIAMQAEMELTSSEKPNLSVAKHAVDTLAILLEKTQGNLSLEEKRMLENTVTELRFRYVQCAQEPAKS